MRFHVLSSDLQNITIRLDVPSYAAIEKEYTGWHPELVTTIGGWVYNSTTDSYDWDSTAEVSQWTDVWGTYTVEEWGEVNLPTRTINRSSAWYDEFAQEWINNTWQEIQTADLYLVYDISSGFSIHQGFETETWVTDPWGGYYRRSFILEPINTSYSNLLIYALNATTSGVWSDPEGEGYYINFVGQFTDYVRKGDHINTEATVLRNDGSQMWFVPNFDWWSSGLNEFVIETPVALTRVLSQTGLEYKNWMAQVDPNEWFIIESTMQGGIGLSDDLDGVGIRLTSSDGQWTPEWSWWSELNIFLDYDIALDEISLSVHNRTERYGYIDSTYMTWGPENLTEFHWVWNDTLAEWMWINSTYEVWTFHEETGYHWTNEWFNQTSQEWVEGGVNWRSKFTVVNKTLVSLNNVSITQSDGSFIVAMNLTFTPQAPELEYWYDVQFYNYTYTQDWSEPYGPYEAYEWVKETIYYIDFGGQNLYLEKPDNPLSSMITSDLNTYYMVDAKPFIVIGGEKLPIQIRENYDSY
jgi:hypothetical protein